MSPEGEALRAKAAKQEALAEDVSSAAKKTRSVRASAGGAIAGFPFAGPFEREATANVGRGNEWLDTVAQQLTDAVAKIQDEADELRSKALAADIVWEAKRLIEAAKRLAGEL